MRVLVPGDPVGPARLRQLYAYPPPGPDGWWVRASMITTVDGAVAGGDGLSGSISNPDDRLMLATLRALADVILVGAGTATGEGYRRTRPHPAFAAARQGLGQHPAPPLVLVTGSGRVPQALLDGPGVVEGTPRVLVATTTAARPALVERLGEDAVLACGDTEVDLPRLLRALAGRGLRRVLCEGGPTLLGAVAGAGLLDELCLTTSPLLAGGPGPRLLAGPPAGRFLRLAHQLVSGDFLFSRWVADRPPNPPR